MARGATVVVDGHAYEIHFGRPGRPAIYRRHGTTMRRVSADDPVLKKVAVAYKRQVEEKKAAKIEEAERRTTLRYRVFRWIGRTLARARAWFVRTVGSILDPFGDP